MSRRISASSSTIRMSCMQRQLRCAGIRLVEHQSYRGTTPWPVVQYQIAVMVFHDLLDDGEPEACPLGAGGDIRLAQPLALLRRQPAAIVVDRDDDAPPLRHDAELDHARLVIALAAPTF